MNYGDHSRDIACSIPLQCDLSLLKENQPRTCIRQDDLSYLLYDKHAKMPQLQRM